MKRRAEDCDAGALTVPRMTSDMIISGGAPLVAALLGVVAGLAVALPLGAIGVLLLQEGMVRGRRAGLAAATGVATVDLMYAAGAVLAGGFVTQSVVGRESGVRLLGAVVLTALALRGLLRALRYRESTEASTQTTSRGAFWRFVALTALNPLTAVYFTVLAAGLGERVRGPAAATAFALGVFAGSWVWQAGLAVGGAYAGRRLPSGARTWTSVAGYGIVLVLAALLGLSAVSA